MMTLRQRLSRVTQVGRVGLVAAIEAMTEVHWTAEERADFDQKIVDILTKAMPDLSTYIRTQYEQAHPDPYCVDCRIFGGHFMLHNDVWAKAAGKDSKGRLCLPCIEKRLGRPLVIDDFSAVPLNNPIRYLHGLVEVGRASDTSS